MSNKKWGESFLKTGLPLEHLALVTFRSLGFQTYPHIEYMRENRDGVESWFELDLSAVHPQPNLDTLLTFLVECKYHDLSRFWFFLPYQESEEHEINNDSVLNCGPVQTLSSPDSESILALASKSYWGAVISKDGQKQENSVYKAIQQIVNSFVPHILYEAFDVDGYIEIPWTEEDMSDLPFARATVPMIVTNAKIFRLKSNISALETIREASSQDEIADEVAWTWCYYKIPNALENRNSEQIDEFSAKAENAMRQIPLFGKRINLFCERPKWIAIVNINSLSDAVSAIYQHFMDLKTANVYNIIQK